MRPFGWTLLLAAGLAATVTACGGGAELRAEAVPDGVEHGLVLTTTTTNYIVVLDIIPPEVMYTARAASTTGPSEGELVIHGRPTPATGADTRHVEVHVYDRATGRVVTGAAPQLTLVDHTAGRSTPMDATEMRDLDLGDLDIHYGSNVALAPGHRFTMRFRLGSDTTEFEGELA